MRIASTAQAVVPAAISANAQIAEGAKVSDTVTTPTDSASLSSGNSKDTAKKIITGSAYTAGGGMGGLVLGGIGGALLTNVTGNPLFATHGGVVGATAGAISGLAASYSDEPGTLKRTLVSWGGATAGTAVGMFVAGHAGTALAANGASAFFGNSGAMVGALAGGLAGAAVCFSGHRGQVSGGIKHLGSAAVGAAAGIFIGGTAQAIAHSAVPHLPHLVAAAPALCGVAGGALALYFYMNPDSLNGTGGY